MPHPRLVYLAFIRDLVCVDFRDCTGELLASKWDQCLFIVGFCSSKYSTRVRISLREKERERVNLIVEQDKISLYKHISDNCRSRIKINSSE